MNSKNDPFDFQILNLTHQFFVDYPDPPYKEIIRKENRPYNCLLLQSHYGYFICVPYRSHINHKYAFKFKSSCRSKKTKSGLDYSKTTIITKPDYIGSANAIIDKDEFNETRNNIHIIKNDVQHFIDNYVDYQHGISSYNEKEFNRIYQYSTLKYFHKELGISKQPDNSR